MQIFLLEIYQFQASQLYLICFIVNYMFPNVVNYMLPNICPSFVNWALRASTACSRVSTLNPSLKDNLWTLYCNHEVPHYIKYIYKANLYKTLHSKGTINNKQFNRNASKLLLYSNKLLVFFLQFALLFHEQKRSLADQFLKKNCMEHNSQRNLPEPLVVHEHQHLGCRLI